jgi:hypothetical protein
MMSLAWPLFRITEQAALAAWPQTGCGDKNKIDGLAVTAMREALNSIGIRGRIVIGEGEIDRAPMLWIGEEVGNGVGPEVISPSILSKEPEWWRWGKAMRWPSWRLRLVAVCYTPQICT